MPEQFATFCEPAFDQWETCLSANLERSGSAVLSKEQINSLRCRLINEAYNYTVSLSELLPELVCPDSPLYDSTIPILMTGHQPVIYHQGILHKNILLDRFANEHKSIGINVIIDTDEGNSGLLDFPFRINDTLEIRHASISCPEGVYLFQRIKSRSELNSVFAEITAGLQCAGVVLSRAFLKAGELYRKLAMVNVAKANTAVRRCLSGDNQSYEIPLSRICTFPETLAFFSSIIKNANQFHDFYNKTLGEYRSDQHISNKANPFPDLTMRDRAVELPFWLIDHENCRRDPVFVTAVDGEIFIVLEDKNIKLELHDGVDLSCIENGRYSVVPRAALTTIFLRLFCCDFFIHGRGGADYDKFSDICAGKYFNVMMPDFAMVSATRYLFEREVAQVEAGRAFTARLRQMLYHPDQFMDGQGFTSELSEKIRMNLVRKAANLDQMSLALTKAQRADIARQVKLIDGEIKKAIEESFSRDVEKTKNTLDDSAAKLYFYRKFPFFFF